MDFATANYKKDTKLTVKKKMDGQNGEDRVKKESNKRMNKSKQEKETERKTTTPELFLDHLSRKLANLDVIKTGSAQSSTSNKCKNYSLKPFS